MTVALALKGVLVLGVAAGLARAARSSSASTGHAVWASAFALLLAVPVLGALGPAWSVAVLPAPDVALGGVGAAVAPSGGLVGLSPSHGAVWATGVWATGVWAVGVWAVGAVVVSLVWGRALALAARLVRRARPETDPEWAALADRAARATGLRRPVRLLRSDALAVPVAWGLGRAAVVLPPWADGWDAERREAVLLHEMAHLRRGDAWTRLVAQAALAVHWFNPLAWWAYGRLAGAAERACDDAVLRAGAPPTGYAGHLVAVAREVVAPPVGPPRLALAAVASMADRSELEGRVRSILDADRTRGPLGRRALGFVALAVAVGVPLAAFQPVSATAVVGAGIVEGRGLSVQPAPTTPADTLDEEAAPAPDTRPSEEDRQRPEQEPREPGGPTADDQRAETQSWNALAESRTAAEDAEAARRDAEAASRNAATEARGAEVTARGSETERRNAEAAAGLAEVERRNAETAARNAATEMRNALTELRNAETAARNALRAAQDALDGSPSALPPAPEPPPRP